jgi:hypothetical protein
VWHVPKHSTIPHHFNHPSSSERALTSAMGLDNAAGTSVACTESSSQAFASKSVAEEPAANLQTPYSKNNMRTTTPHDSLYLSSTPALTASSRPPSSPAASLQTPYNTCLHGQSHQTKQLGSTDTPCGIYEETDIESFDDDASIRPRRVIADPDTLMAAEMLMRLCGRNDDSNPTGTPTFKVLGPAFSTPTNVPLREISSQRSNPSLFHPTLADPSLVTTQRPSVSISDSANCLQLASPFGGPSPRTSLVDSMSDQRLEISPNSPNTEATAHSVIEGTAVVSLAPLPPTGTPQATPQVTQATPEGVEVPKITLKSQSRKRKREPGPAADSPHTPETKRIGLKIPKTAKCRNVLSSNKKYTDKIKDTISKSSRSAKKDPSLSPKSIAASEGLIGHLITVLSLDGRSSIPFSKIVERVLESQPHLLDERPAAEWPELVKKTLNYSKNTMFGRAERKGLKVYSYTSKASDRD